MKTVLIIGGVGLGAILLLRVLKPQQQQPSSTSAIAGAVTAGFNALGSIFGSSGSSSSSGGGLSSLWNSFTGGSSSSSSSDSGLGSAAGSLQTIDGDSWWVPSDSSGSGGLL